MSPHRVCAFLLPIQQMFDYNAIAARRMNLPCKRFDLTDKVYFEYWRANEWEFTIIPIDRANDFAYHSSRNDRIRRKLSCRASSHSLGYFFSAVIMCFNAHFAKPFIESRPSVSAWLPFS